MTTWTDRAYEVLFKGLDQAEEMRRCRYLNDKERTEWRKEYERLLTVFDRLEQRTYRHAQSTSNH